MKAHDKYRYTLQWGSDNQDQIRAGDLMERLGNKKSEFIIAAITEYIKSHPEIMSKESKIQIVVNSSISQDQLTKMVRAIIEEKLGDVTSGIKQSTTETPSQTIGTDEIDEMIDNLDFFE